MSAFFFVFLFDYYVNQDVKLLPKEKKEESESQEKKKGLAFKILNSVFSLGSKIYKSIPILQFHIGEQYLLISLFLFFNQTRLFLYLVTGLGMFYSIYWPIAQYYGKKPSSD